MELRNMGVAALGAAVISFVPDAAAVDWLMLRGTEPQKVSHRFFGAAAVSYFNYSGCERLDGLARPDGTPEGDVNSGPGLNNGYFVNNCRVRPGLENDNAGFNFDSLGFGARGNIVPGRFNYFLSVNLGENAANYKPMKTDREYLASITDASVTFSAAPGFRLQAGLFPKPGPEELMESLKARDFIYLTDFVRRDQIERFVEGTAKGTSPIPGQGYAGSVSTYAYDADIGRDWGIQLFDAIKSGEWTHSYALMLANGNGIHHTDNNDEKDVNLYFSSEYDLPGGAGPDKHGVKLYGYYQHGVRNFITDDSGTESEDFERIRYGIGLTAQGRLFGESGHVHSVGAALMYAEGMVLQSATTSVTDGPYGGLIQIAAERENKARGITLDYGFRLNKNWQFGMRYSRNDLLYETVENKYWNDSDYRIITELGLAATYNFTPKTRLTFNYVFRESEAPNEVEPGSDSEADINNALVKTRNAEIATSTVGDFFGFSLVHFF